MEISNFNENYTRNFIFDLATIPLVQSLAVAAFMDLRHEAAQIQCDAGCNEGSIISEFIRSPAIFQSVQSKDVAHELPYSLKNPFSGLLHRRNFTSMLSALWKRFIISRM